MASSTPPTLTLAATSFTERKVHPHMDDRSTRGDARRRDRRDGRRVPRPVASERPETGPSTTEAIHRELFSDYKPAKGPLL